MPELGPVKIIVLILVLGLLGWAGPDSSLAQQDRYEVHLDGHRLEVELAISRQDRMRGLSGRTYLPENKGMLFIYQRKTTLRFWMSGMKMGIDLLWLDNDRVLGIEPDLQPPSPGQQPRMVFSPGPVDRVLEVRAGWAARHGVKPGALLKGPHKF